MSISYSGSLLPSANSSQGSGVANTQKHVIQKTSHSHSSNMMYLPGGQLRSLMPKTRCGNPRKHWDLWNTQQGAPETRCDHPSNSLRVSSKQAVDISKNKVGSPKTHHGHYNKVEKLKKCIRMSKKLTFFDPPGRLCEYRPDALQASLGPKGLRVSSCTNQNIKQAELYFKQTCACERNLSKSRKITLATTNATLAISVVMANHRAALPRLELGLSSSERKLKAPIAEANQEHKKCQTRNLSHFQPTKTNYLSCRTVTADTFPSLFVEVHSKETFSTIGLLFISIFSNSTLCCCTDICFFLCLRS